MRAGRVEKEVLLLLGVQSDGVPTMDDRKCKSEVKVQSLPGELRKGAGKEKGEIGYPLRILD